MARRSWWRVSSGSIGRVLAGRRGAEWLDEGLLSLKIVCLSPVLMVLQARRNGALSVILRVDPHKLSATIDVVDERERMLRGGRYCSNRDGTNRDGYRQMLAAGRRWADRVWAVDGCNDIGRHVAQRLVASGEKVMDVPAKLSARTQESSTGPRP